MVQYIFDLQEICRKKSKRFFRASLVLSSEQTCRLQLIILSASPPLNKGTLTLTQLLRKVGGVYSRFHTTANYDGTSIN